MPDLNPAVTTSRRARHGVSSSLTSRAIAQNAVIALCSHSRRKHGRAIDCMTSKSPLCTPHAEVPARPGPRASRREDETGELAHADWVCFLPKRLWMQDVILTQGAHGVSTSQPLHVLKTPPVCSLRTFISALSLR